ncbi:maker417, partial [Drosophila busckii]
TASVAQLLLLFHSFIKYVSTFNLVYATLVLFALMPTPRGLNIRLVHAIRRLSQCKILNSPIALLESCCGNNLFLDQKIAMTLCTQQDDIVYKIQAKLELYNDLNFAVPH